MKDNDTITTTDKVKQITLMQDGVKIAHCIVKEEEVKSIQTFLNNVCRSAAMMGLNAQYQFDD